MHYKSGKYPFSSLYLLYFTYFHSLFHRVYFSFLFKCCTKKRYDFFRDISFHGMMYTVYSILYDVFCMMHIVYCILYTIYCILYTVYRVLTAITSTNNY